MVAFFYSLAFRIDAANYGPFLSGSSCKSEELDKA